MIDRPTAKRAAADLGGDTDDHTEHRPSVCATKAPGSWMQTPKQRGGQRPLPSTTCALTIAVGALRYFMIKFHLNSVIAFDFKDALNFEGDSGPYLQYTMVRTNSILIKLAADDRSPWGQIGSLDILDNRELPPYWELILNLSQIELQVEYALENLDLCSLASFTYSLCQKFNHYYHLFPVISEPDSRVRSLRVALVLVFKSKLEKLLRTMGIPVPEKM